MSIGRVPGATGIQPSIVTAKGDLIVATASGSVTNQAVGSNNQVLTADSAQADGVKWANGSAATLTTTGDLLYASAANTPARLAIGSTDQVLKVSGGVPAWGAAPSPTFVGASVYSTVNISISNTTYLLLTWDAEYFDSDNLHSTSTNTSRLTIPTGKGGKYLISGTVWFGNNATGYRLVELSKNGSAITYFSAAPFSGDSTILPISYTMNLVAGDYVELRAWQNSGGSLNFIGGTQNASFQISYLGA